MRSVVIALATMLTAGCEAKPRSATYFHAHPDVARQLADACRLGDHRGEECRNAEEGLAAERIDQRLEMFRRGAGL